MCCDRGENDMRRGGLGILVFLIVALLVAFLMMKHMQNPTALSDTISQAASDTLTDAAQSAVNAINEAVQNTGLMENLQGILGGIE